jgi:hypothetical protein
VNPVNKLNRSYGGDFFSRFRQVGSGKKGERRGKEARGGWGDGNITGNERGSKREGKEEGSTPAQESSFRRGGVGDREMGNGK